MNAINKLRIIHILQVLIALIGGILAIADKIKDLSGIIPPQLTPYWSLVVTSAIAVKPTILLLLDLFDDGVINNSSASK